MVAHKYFEFHKVMLRHYSGEVEDVYIVLKQIYSGNNKTNFTRITQVL